MHVCTALNVQNDFYTLYSLLFRFIDARDLVALFACAQRAYGTRVDIVQHCVRVENAHLRCLFRIDGKKLSCIGDVVMLCDVPHDALHFKTPARITRPFRTWWARARSSKRYFPSLHPPRTFEPKH